ncbi:uncharacterized protein LOC122297273 isoform X1 [Carya illinoinensis]|uniref:uncharacterized protein LOC122297273 isoform X1 n=1 Tax=Carya illinoinensis TaxID=32201 RepID=UPI001C71FC61|nr:uncharacterized protein LOC122297273 isoform X1 [Carya illinoinensis]
MPSGLWPLAISGFSLDIKSSIVKTTQKQDRRTGLICRSRRISREREREREMALQWVILTYLVAVEAAIAVLLTLPSPKLVKNRLVSLVSLILQPALFVVPFAGFQLLDIYWKNEHRLMCTSEICTASERDRYEKSVSFSFFLLIYKAQRNVILCAASILLYWSVYRICKYHKEIQHLEEVEKKSKEL